MSLQIDREVSSCRVVQFLGAGGFGREFRMVKTVSKVEFACKEVNLTLLRTVGIETAISEIKIHKELHHVNVIRFYGAECHNNLVFIDLELASSCLIDEVRKGLSAALCRRYFRDLISGVEYLHSMCVAHRDIKSQNLLIGRDGRLKIADFGLATHFQPDKMVEGMCGTLQYMAPEVHTGLYDPQPADIWSCGVVLLEMGTQKCHWPSTNSPEFIDYHKKYLSPSSMVFGSVNSRVQHLLGWILEKEPYFRAKIVSIKKHSWFLGC